VSSSPNRQVAYVIADPGSRDADGDGSVFDGTNATASTVVPGYDPPEGVLGDQNDDRTRAIGFDAISRTLNCDTSMRALNLMADSVVDAIGEVQSMATDINTAGGTAPVFWTDTSAPSVLSRADASGLAQ